jgi:hypothetical protein
MASGYPTGWISTVSEFIQLNTTARAGAVILPSTFLAPGRSLTFKDTQGTFSRNPVTFSTINIPQVFENNTTRQVRNDTLGAYTFTSGSNNTWYITGGSFMPVGIISSLTSIHTSSITVSTANTTLSSVKFTDILFGGTQDLYMRSTLLMFGSTNIPWAGTRVGGPRFQIAPARPFSPTLISGLVLWLDGADTNTVQSVPMVNRWFDKSPTRKIAIQNAGVGGGTIFPLYENRQLFFNNTAALLNIGSMPLAPYDLFVVGTALSNNTFYRTFIRTDGAPGTHPLLLEQGTNRMGMWSGSGFNQFGSLTMLPNEQAMVYVSVASDITMRASKNGTVQLTASTPAGNLSRVFCIGNNVSGFQNCGSINEVIFYSATLTQAQRQQVEGYLAWKWGLVGNLPSEHPFKRNPPFVT